MNPRDDAEKATLGAVLSEPGRLAELSDWLDPEDFHSPQHQAIYRAMLILDQRGAAPDLSRGDPDERARHLATYVIKLANHVTEDGTRLDTFYLYTLMHTCPRPENAPHYGRMVVEADTHRTIIENATRLAQAAHTHQQTGNPWMEDLFIHTAAFRQVLDNLAERWGINPDDFDNPTADPAVREIAEEAIRQAVGTNAAGFADQFAPELDAPPTPEQRAAAVEREDTVLACILRSPDQLDEIRDFLDPDDFTAPDRAACYRAALTLRDRGDPIDPMTLTWETRRHGTPTGTSDNEQNEATPLTYDRLTKLWGDGLPAQVATYHARGILENSIRTTTAEAARDLKTLAVNPRINPPDLLTAAAHRIDQAADLQDRWHASRPPDQSQPYEPLTEQRFGTSRAF